MSFYSYRNCENELCPGRINGDAGKGLCERVAVQVRRIYDSCMQQEQLENIPVSLTGVVGDFTAPLTYQGMRSNSTAGVLTDLSVTRLPDRPHCCRVTATVAIPITVSFTDANNRAGSGAATISVKKDVILYVPDDSIIPYSIDSIVSAAGINGAYVSNYSFIIDACVTVILKVGADVDLLLPCYGLCRIPPCEEFSSEVCDDFFNLPIFPVQTYDTGSC
ncbi:MAG: hypothetical protein KIG36_01010 [Eubacteriales bacterium]|nr:hypothetical protein [Eubacteriales bacterium]